MPGRKIAVHAARHAGRLLGTKGRSELAFWTDKWDAAIRNGGLWGPDALELSGDTEVAETYGGRRLQQARAEVKRVLVEAKIDDDSYFAGKVVLDIGPGCMGFPDACPAAVSIGVDPLAQDYAEAGLLLESNAVYLSVPAESIPLRSASVDVIIARNSLDHVDSPTKVLAEVLRLLRPGGEFIVNVDVDHPPSPTEPHEISRETLNEWFSPFEIITEDVWDHGHAEDDSPVGYAIVIRARKPLA